LKGIPLKNYPTNARNYSFSPDGQTLAVGTASGVLLWDLPSGNQRIELPGLRSPAAVAFSPDGKTVAASSIISVALWDAATAVQVGTISDLSRNSISTIRLLRFSPDSKTLAGAGEESVIRVWDVATGKERDAGIGHREAITGIAFAPDGSSQATVAARDRYVRLWNAVSGSSLQAFLGGAQARTPIFSPDGRTVLAGGTYLFMWDAVSGKVLQRLGFPNQPLARAGVLPSVESIALSPDGTTIWGLTTQRPVAQRAPGAAADEGSIRVASWDTATGKETSLREDPSEANSLWQLSPDGRLRVSTRSGLIKVYEVANGKLMATLDGQCTSVSVIAFSSDSKKIAGLCFQDDERPLSASVWELPAGTETHRILTQMKPGRSGGSGYHLAALTFSWDGKILATGAQENSSIQLWDLETSKEIGHFQGYAGTVTSLAFDPSGRRLASGLANGTALIWDVASAAKQLPLVKISKGIDRAPVLIRKPLTDSPKPLEGATNIIRQLLQEAQRTTSKVEDSSARAHGLEQCAILQSRSGNLALERSLFEEARKLIAEMPQEKKVEARRELARCCGQAGDLEEIKKVLESIPFVQRPNWASNQEDMVYYLASTALAQAGKMTEALELARANKHADNPQSRCDLIVADSATYFALAGDPKKAMATLDSISYPLLKVLTLAGNVRDDYWNNDLPNFPHGIAMKLDEAGNRPAALEFLNRAEEIAGTLKEPDKQARSWAAIACCRARMGDLKGCQSLLQRIPPDSSFRPYPLIAIARAYVAAGQGESAPALIGQLKGNSLQSQGFAQLAAGQVATGDGRAALDSADKAWELVQTYSFAFGAANSLMDIRIQANDFQGAAALFTSLGREQNLLVSRGIAAHQSRTGDFVGARKTIDDHLSSFSLLKPQELQKLARSQTEHNQEKEALAWARQLSKPEEQAYALLGVAEGLFKRQK
jgi:WD40 repeat protein